MTTPPAIVILGAGALDTARRIQARYPGARVHGLASRVDADVPFDELGAQLRELYARGAPIVALCAAGIVIRCIAPALADKGVEPPVLAVAEDGSAVVPLLGGLTGVNAIAREIADALGVAPAITTSGELRFGACVLNPPDGYALADLQQGKRFVSDLLAGAATRIDGAAPWLDDVALPRDAAATHAIRVTPDAWRGARDELVIHPRSVVVGVDAQGARADAAASCGEQADPLLAQRIGALLDAHGLARQALAALVAPATLLGDARLDAAAHALGVPLRFADVDAGSDATALLGRTLRVAHTLRGASGGLACAVAAQPVDPATLGRARGRLTVLGLGPGDSAWLTPAARAALADATDILGYTTYVTMAGPFRVDQRVHGTDNREEMQRARHAFELAAEGRRVAVVSSGDPGVFAMAAAVLEALDEARDPQWAAVELRIEPGVSASLATAAQAGAPLGHDFCAISLSDNLKPWEVIETRLRHAAQADLVMAFYNPISRARPWQLDRALDAVRAHRAADTVVVLGRDIGRPGATLVTTTLGALRSDQVDMRTMVIVGSSTTRRFAIGDGREWVYTPRWYR
ncbi:precorrin-3B C(17)-methyltransferase [Burkholderia vietnamiensis]|uniref:precorrin-3B C(17)-methyltransferase n=1 Tax=Burkholderia vietnamiensis TaxID=60552 RepID=UPI00158F0ADF|nr:precorrin-3B C(17)-methyltransferase [Burkholderia vietnamiensis]MBH9644821.1 precorrin-3B C(17)-methyltransferase [Burkholderia vietnamiensis]MCA7945007.1 precorrin-3B C(17)-methyltransferase [Burkholderia vietnamiensis]HDR8971876.1 precorrin-3B C(17)-methyltransferase [Burkholderia vietnamiensis]HDR9145590.1 precorrin-3B C(17)-methyltransferase [Burkholderia vietnamiensis]HDR9223051.1 precorrin-3B C(17)-methyltransferase [Burkholderia vietnamiensis]